jgi:transcriptional antiterminator NusG
MSEENMNAENGLPEETSTEPRWYVVHTYSGYENKVKANIEKAVENRGMQELICEIDVPMQDEIEEKNGQRRTVKHKTYAGYVFIKMVMNDETWYVVRNTRGVTSFVGPGSKPVPLTEEEVTAMGIEQTSVEFDFELGESVQVSSGPFKNSTGVIKEINESKHTVIVNLSIFGRETPVELDYTQLEKLE